MASNPPGAAPASADDLIQKELLAIRDKSMLIAKHFNLASGIVALVPAITTFLNFDDHCHSLHGGYAQNSVSRGSFAIMACIVRKIGDQIQEYIVEVAQDMVRLIGNEGGEEMGRRIEFLKIGGRDPGGMALDNWERMLWRANEFLTVWSELDLAWKVDDVENVENVEGGGIKIASRQLDDFGHPIITVAEEERVRIRAVMVRLRDIARAAFETPIF